MKLKEVEGLEMTTFALVDNCTIAEFITANADIDAWLKTQPGFKSRHIAERGDGTIADMLLWDKTVSGRNAMHRLMDEMRHSPVHDLIDQGTVSWNVWPVWHSID